MVNWWMVRAGRNAELLELFLEREVVVLGGVDSNLNALKNQKEGLDIVTRAHPDWKLGKQRMWAGQLVRFVCDIQLHDWVLTYNPELRAYHIGKFEGEYEFQPHIINNHPHYRKVTWFATVNRDDLSSSTKNSLGAISSLFQVPNQACFEIEAILNGKNGKNQIPDDNEIKDNDELLDDPEVMAIENIKDRLNRLDWEEMQDLIAGILRAMGYKTEISPKGSDRGKDIVASPDGLGFEEPRIVVEVKHREGTSIGAPTLRGFLGGRHPGDKGLYVSTGGFTKDAYYEAERAKIPLALINLNDLVKLLIEYYERLDMNTKNLIPLKKIFWPL